MNSLGNIREFDTVYETVIYYLEIYFKATVSVPFDPFVCVCCQKACESNGGCPGFDPKLPP